MRRIVKYIVKKYRRTISAALVLALPLAGCGPSIERAFSNCVESAEKQSLAANKGKLSPDFAKIIQKTSRAMAEQSCSVIRDECKQDHQSDTCRRLIEQYGR